MRKRLATWAMPLFAIAMLSPVLRAQAVPAAPQPQTTEDGWGRKFAKPVKGQKSAPAPKHDISGVWDPDGPGFSPYGAIAMPSDGRPEHELPFTAAGREAFLKNKPGFGVTEVPAALTNDPVNSCDPQGMPRADLHALFATQIVQTPLQVLVLYTYDQLWRSIWTDGRELPKDPEPKWLGYSTGTWVDDTTFVAQTIGLDERTWVDNAGRPHSDAMRVEEKFHRVDADTLEFTVTLDDPKFYSKPWIAADKVRFKLMPPSFQVPEMLCSPTEIRRYNQLVGDPVAK
jgi:hypothetical protein